MSRDPAMNAQTPKSFSTDTSTTTELSMFDFSRWKPITPEQFVGLFAEQAFTVEDGEPIASLAEDMPDDRIRMVVYAKMENIATGKTAVEPHLVILYDPETRKQGVVMMRTDAKLHKSSLERS